MKLTRILPYLFLNVIVSAVTTFIILWWWQQGHPAQPTIIIPPSTTALSGQSMPKSQTPIADGTALVVSVPSSGEKVVEIQNVFGAGDVQTEVVRIKHIGEGELVLTGWKLLGGSGGDYIFPELTLYKDGAIEVYTRAGVDSPIELHRRLDQAVLSKGDTVKLMDLQGNLRASYQVP